MTNEDSISGSIGDKQLAIKGASALVIVVLAIALAAIIYYVEQDAKHGRAQAESLATRLEIRSTQEHNALLESLRELKQVNQYTNKAIDEQSFIILMPESEQNQVRARLRMPDSLREKLDDPLYRRNNGR